MNKSLQRFYGRLLEVLRQPVVRQGQWQLLECVPAWDGNGSSDAFIAQAWQDPGGARLLAAVNYANHPSQCYVRLPFSDLSRGRWQLRDLMGDAHYERDGIELQSRGLYLDLNPWQYHLFEMKSPDDVCLDSHRGSVGGHHGGDARHWLAVAVFDEVTRP